MKKINQIIREYFFEFSAKEANGFVLLIILAGILLVIPSFLRFFPQTASSSDELRRDEELTAQALFELEISEKKQQTYKKKTQNNKNYKQAVFHLFDFNPNEIGVEEWKKLGLEEYLAKRIEKYKSKGGTFRYKTDLRKIYGFHDWLYDRLESHILLPERFDEGEDLVQNREKKYASVASHQVRIVPTSYSKKYAIEPFDINSADTATLRQVKGIGAVLSQRIVNFRDKLGGFCSLEQIREVYGLSPETQDELLKYANLQGSDYHKIKINHVDFEELKKHPYVSYKLAKVIINYRKQNGDYSTTEDLRKIRMLDNKTFQKITPYLSFDH